MKQIRNEYFKHKVRTVYVPLCITVISILGVGVVVKDVTKTNKVSAQSMSIMEEVPINTAITHAIGRSAEYSAQQAKTIATTNYSEVENLIREEKAKERQNIQEPTIVTTQVQTTQVNSQKRTSSDLYTYEIGRATCRERVYVLV